MCILHLFCSVKLDALQIALICSACVDWCEQSSVDTALAHCGQHLGLSCTVLLESREELSAEKQAGSSVMSETASPVIAFSDRYR